MYDMWKRQQVHENERTMHRAKVHGKEFGKMVKATSGRPRFGKNSGQPG